MLGRVEKRNETRTRQKCSSMPNTWNMQKHIGLEPTWPLSSSGFAHYQWLFTSRCSTFLAPPNPRVSIAHSSMQFQLYHGLSVRLYHILPGVPDLALMCKWKPLQSFLHSACLKSQHHMNTTEVCYEHEQ